MFMNTQSKFKVSGILIIFALLLASRPTSVVHSQTGGEYTCGQFQRLDAGTRGFPAFVPFGFENDPNGWWIIQTLNGNLLITSTGEEIDPIANYGRSIRIWYPEFSSGNNLISVSSYEFVDTCAPVVTPILDFYVDNTTIYAGECTTLYWNANSVYQQVFLDSTSGPVVSNDGHAPASGSAVVCPPIDTTYRLTGAYDITQDYKDITIYVVQPTSTPIPATSTSIPPTKTRVPPSATAIPPTQESTSNNNYLPYLEITDIKIKPTDIKQYEQSLFLITVINTGTSESNSVWKDFHFTGEIVIKSSNGSFIEKQQFAESQNAFLAPSDNYGERKISVKTKFAETVQNGVMEVFIYTNVDSQKTLFTTLPVTISNENINVDIVQCASVVADKLQIAFPVSDEGSVAIAQNRLMAEVTACQDISCAAKLITGYMEDTSLEYILQKNQIGELIVSIKDIFNGQESINVCRKPALWMFAIFDELIRSGVEINMRAVHSPALITIENGTGQQSGFLDRNTAITEIDGSIAFLYEESQYIYFPTQKVNTQLVGTGNGVMTVDVLDVQGNQVVDASFVDVPVVSKMTASVDSDETNTTMTVVTGNQSQTVQPDYKTIQPVEKKQEESKPLLLIQKNSFFIIAGFLLIVFFGYMFLPRKSQHERHIEQKKKSGKKRKSSR